jgi:hypothetical protein
VESKRLRESKTGIKRRLGDFLEEVNGIEEETQLRNT